MVNKKIAIIGTGSMGGAIVAGLLRSGFIAKSCLFVTDRNKTILADMKQLGVNVTENNPDAVKNADVIILAVKPDHLENVLQDIKPALNVEKILISIVAGVRIENLITICETDVPVFRVMPNTAIAFQESLTFISGNNSSDRYKDYVLNLFGKLGKIMEIPEDLMPAATVLSSCGIAFALRYIRAAMEGGVEIGFSPEISQFITAQTVKGAVELVMQTGCHPEIEIDKVTTPQGVTITGLNEMEYGGFSSSLIGGILASYNKIQGNY